MQFITMQEKQIYWNPKRKLAVTTHFLEIIKQQQFLTVLKYKAMYGIIIKLKLSYL